MNDIRRKLRQLPEPVQDFIFDPESADLTDRVAAENDLEVEERRALVALVNRLYAGELPLGGLADEIGTVIGLKDGRARKLAMDISGYKLLPLDTFLGDVDGYIRSLGGDPGRYPPTRIKVEERTREEAVQDVAGSVRADALPHRLRGRLQDVIRSYFSGVRTDGQLFEILTRPDKIGGLGLSHEAAKRVVEEAKEEKRTVVIAEEKPSAENPAEGEGASGSEKRGPSERQKSNVKSQMPVLDAFAPEDERDVIELSKKLPEEVVAKSAETDEKIKASVSELYAAFGLVPPTVELQARLKKIIENRLRDVRDSMETLETLVQPKELGGMSLPQEEARRLVALIEGKLKAVHEAHQLQVKDEKKAWVEEQTAAQLRRLEEEEAEEERKREEAFRSAVSGSKKAMENAAPSVPLVMPAAPASLSTAPPRPPAPRVMAAPPPIQPPAPAMPPARPKMEDVKFQPKLTGPVEELRGMTVEDFRRLSKDPKEAALKIKDKIDLLGEDSFDLRMQGVAAWGRSGVQSCYLEMMRESLEGTPMEQVIEARKTAGKQYLTKEEIAALVELGGRLRG